MGRMKQVSAGSGLDHDVCSTRSLTGPRGPDQERPRPRSPGQQVATLAPSRGPTPHSPRRQGMGRGWHLTYPDAGLVGGGAGTGRGTDRAAGPRSVASGPPHPHTAPLPRAALKSQVRKPPQLPLPRTLPRIALRRRDRDVIAPAPPPGPLPGLAPPALAQVGALVSSAPARFFSPQPRPDRTVFLHDRGSRNPAELW